MKNSEGKKKFKMKKIRLITFHTPKNYGAVLQAYSLFEFLKKYSEDVKIIDYNTRHLRGLYPIINKPKSFKSFLVNVYLLPTYLKKRKKYDKFNEFVQKKLDLTTRYETINKLYERCEDADIYVTGSDQIFNPGRIKEERQAYYLDFVPKDKIKIAYAASFGKKDIPENLQGEIAKYLSSFSAVSAREISGSKLLKDKFNITSELVLDPVFLNDKAFWEDVAEPYKKHFKKNYLLYYRLLGDKKSDIIVAEIAREKKLGLVVIAEGKCFIKGAKVLRDVGPTEFLGLYRQAAFVATDSFHGVAFSIIFQKQFAFVNYNPKFNFRGLELLERLNMVDRVWFDKNNENRDLVDYDNVRVALNMEIEKSKNFLCNFIVDRG